MDSAAVHAMLRSRQKNCHNCVLIKRRCDRRMPTCSRCIEKGVRCIYAKNKQTVRSWSQRLASANPFGLCGTKNSVPDFNEDYVLDADNDQPLEENTLFESIDPLLQAGSSHIWDGSLDADVSKGLMPNSLGDDICGMGSTDNSWLLPPNDESVIEEVGRTDQEKEVIEYRDRLKECVNPEPWHLFDPRNPFCQATTQLQEFINNIATRSATPFLHRYLYRGYMPKCIVACFGVSVLYANRTPENTSMVMRALHKEVKELTEAETGKSGGNPIDRLARTHALFIYQIIRLLDGNITLRAMGERDLSLLRKWLDDLCTIRNNLDDISIVESNSTRLQPPADWEKWIFEESLRRTILIGYCFLKLYDFLRGIMNAPVDGAAVWSCVHRWTISRHLWEATSQWEFNRKWKATPQFIISNNDMGHFLANGRGDDVDEMGELVLNVCLGVDETRDFISRGTGKRQ